MRKAYLKILDLQSGTLFFPSESWHSLFFGKRTPDCRLFNSRTTIIQVTIKLTKKKFMQPYQ